MFIINLKMDRIFWVLTESDEVEQFEWLKTKQLVKSIVQYKGMHLLP